MPLLKGTAGKAMPDMAIGYITRKDKAKYIDVQNLFIDEDYSAQFKETAARFGKYTDYDERKYYHFKLSPDRADYADPFRVQEYAKAYAEKSFPDCECVIATHTDTRENIRFESGFRKFLLWLTPALLVVQTIVLAISLL